MNSTESKKAYEQPEKKAFRMMATEMAIVTVVIVVEVFFAARVGMHLSSCLGFTRVGRTARGWTGCPV